MELSRVARGAILKGEAGIGVKKRKDITFDDARKLFEAWATASKKARTLKTYKECLRRLGESFSGKRLSDISPFHVEAHKQKRIQAGARVRCNRELGVLTNLFNRCLEWGKFEGANPAASVKPLKEPQQRLRYLEDEEEDRLLAAAPEPLRTIILVGIYCGLRIQSEVLTLRWVDVDLRKMQLCVLAAFAKNGKMRAVPLNSTVRAALESLKAKATGEHVFVKRSGARYTSIRNGFNAACRLARLQGVTPHTLRHTFATRLIEDGVDLRTVQDLGGWSVMRMLERYGHVSQARKAAAVEGLVRKKFPYTIHYTPEQANAKTA